jgi:hypothetical protein
VPAAAAFYRASGLVLWHVTVMPKYLGNVRYWANSGKHVLALSFSGFDPQQTSERGSD